MDQLIRMTATEVVDRLRRRELTALELVDTLCRRIEAVDGRVNAVPTRCFERARRQARSMTEQRSEPADRRGWLAGLPVPIKDNNDVSAAS